MFPVRNDGGIGLDWVCAERKENEFNPRSQLGLYVYIKYILRVKLMIVDNESNICISFIRLIKGILIA